MKKVMSLFWVASICVAMIGCGEGGDSAPAAGGGDAAPAAGSGSSEKTPAAEEAPAEEAPAEEAPAE